MIKDAYLSPETRLSLFDPHQFEPLLHMGLEQACVLLNATSGFLVLAEAGKLSIRAVFPSFTVNTTNILLDDIIHHPIYQAYKSRKPVIISDPDESVRFKLSKDEANIQTLLNLPLQNETSCIGMLVIKRSQIGQPFSGQDVRTGIVFAQIISLLLNTTQLFTTAHEEISKQKLVEEELRSQKELTENLISVARAAVEQPSLDETLQNVLTTVAKIVGAERGSIFLLDSNLRVTNSILVRGQVSQAVKHALLQEVMGKGLSGWVAFHKVPALITEADTDSRWLKLPGSPYVVHSALALPILTGTQKELQGIVMLFHSQPNQFTLAHQEFIQATADQMSSPFEMSASLTTKANYSTARCFCIAS